MDTTQFFIGLHDAERQSISVPFLCENGVVTYDQAFEFGDSVSSLVIERGTALLFDTDAEYSRYAEQNGVASGSVGQEEETSEAKLFVPLNTGQRTLGLMTVQSTRPHAYTQDDVQTLSVIATQAAIAISNARLYAGSESSVRQMEALLSVARSVSSSLDLPTVLNEILEGIRGVVPYHFAAILLPDRKAGHLHIVGAMGPVGQEDHTAAQTSLRTVPFGEGVTGVAFKSRKTLVVTDRRLFDTRLETWTEDTQSEVAVPLMRGVNVVGILDVERTEINAFASQDVAVLELFASQAAIAIENARLFTEQARRVHELQMIQAIVRKLTPLHDIPAIAALVNRELSALIDYGSCRLFFLNPKDNMLAPVAFEGAHPHTIRLHLGEGVTGWIALYGLPVLIPNLLQDPRASHVAGTPLQPESLIGAPLVFEGKVRGVITLSKLGADQFDDNDLRLLEIIAAQAAIAFDRSRIYDELRNEAVTDELTSLDNRRCLLERFREERSRAVRNQHTLVALMLDLDKFKIVNDTFGHDAGDVVLRDLAGLIRAFVRAEDLVARYGGEEFCILLPEIARESAELVADRLRALIADRIMPAGAGVKRVTVSVGMTVLLPSDTDVELFSRADLAMYRAKRAGGNCVCIEQHGDFQILPNGHDPVPARG